MRDSTFQSTSSRQFVSVIVPTLNETDNIDILLEAVLAQRSPSLDIEVLVADGGSTDGTIDRVRAWESRAPVRLMQSPARRGLAGDVLDACRQAQAPVIVVMDADLSHPPKTIAALVAPIHAGVSDMVIASRYIEGGSTPAWPMKRQMMSRIAGVFAWPMTDVRDPMSGFFAVRKDALLAVDPAAAGFKIGLEVMAAAGDGLRVSEVPIAFVDRERGQSKIGVATIAAYIRRLMVLAGGAVSLDTAARFAAVGAIGLIVDGIVSEALYAAGASLLVANVMSFTLATVLNYALNANWSFASAAQNAPARDYHRYARFLVVCLLALCFRGGVIATAIEQGGYAPQTALLLGIFAAAVVNYTGSAFYIFPSTYAAVSPVIRWRMAALGMFLYATILRLAFIGPMSLMPEEAYYWNYSEHLDIGYLDHPPMVAWLIALGTELFGKSEFAVRIFAEAAWVLTAIFSFKLTRNLYGKSAAFIALALISTLPFFFFSGLLMMPELAVNRGVGGSAVLP